MCIKEERKLGCKFIHIHTRLDRGFYVGNGICKRESHFLHCGRTSFADVISGDADGIPIRHFGLAVLENVCD